MFASASGVLKHRAMPKSRCRPSVVPNTPPLPSTSAISSSGASATSSPNTRMRSSAAITSCSVRRMASPKATTSPSVRRRAGVGRSSGARRTWSSTVAGRRAGRGERLLGGGGHLGDGRRSGSRRPRRGWPTAGEHQLLEEDDRIVLELVLELVVGSVLGLGVGRGVRVGPGDGGVEQPRALAGAHAGDGSAPAGRLANQSRPSTFVIAEPPEARGPSPRSARWPGPPSGPRWRSRCRPPGRARGGAAGRRCSGSPRTRPRPWPPRRATRR